MVREESPEHLSYEIEEISLLVYTTDKLPDFFFFVTKAYIYLQIPCTFRGGFSSTDIAPLSYITDTQNSYQIKAYRTGYLNISLLFQENKFPGFL